MNKFDYKNLTPFKWFVLENFPFIEADFDALTEWQLFCKLGKEINKIIDSQNLVGEQAENLTNAFNNLKNYFDNLDFQDEINNKLNEMVETGELQNILMNYTFIQKTYNTYQDMINDTTLKVGQKVKTLGYYNINDGGNGEYYIRKKRENDIIDNGFIGYITEDIICELIINNNKINIKQYGAKGTNTDDTIYFIKALDFMKNNNDINLIIPEGDYIINDTLYLSSYNKLIGTKKYKCTLRQGENLTNKPIIATNKSNNERFSNITIKNINIIAQGNRTEQLITIYNATYTEIDNCYIQGSPLSQYNGVLISRTSTFTGENFVNKIHDCRFSQSTLILNGSDSYIERNELWGNEQECALKIMLYASNSIISNNQIVGGKKYGGIYFDEIGEKGNYQITNNYFDGSYNNIDTQYGIYSNSTLKDSIISNNKFWKQKSGGIFLLGSINNIISNNCFIDCDYYNLHKPDIQISTNTLKNAFSNIITNNSFSRVHCLADDKKTVISRPNTNTSAPIEIYQTSTFPETIIANNTLTYPDRYSNIIIANSFNVITTNNSPKLQKDISVSTIASQSYKFNLNNTNKNLTLFINNPNLCENGPADLTKAGIFTNYYITNGYQEQEINTFRKIYRRSQQNGSWSDWASVELNI